MKLCDCISPLLYMAGLIVNTNELKVRTYVQVLNTITLSFSGDSPSNKIK